MAEISGRGVLVQDKRLGLLAHQPSSALASLWEELLEQLCKPESLPPALRDRKSAGRETPILTQSLPGGLARRVASITVGEVARGYLSLVGLEGELDSLDQTVLEQGALVCAVEMARAKAVRETEKRLKGDLLAALLQNDLSPRDARLWVLAMGLDLDQAHVALRFAWDSATPPSRRRLETLVNGEVSRRGLKVIVHPMGAEVACFCEAPVNAARSQVVMEFSQAVLAQGALEYPHIPIRCGIGRPAADLSEWRSSFREAGEALELARRFGDREPLFYTDLTVYRLLLQI
jgi:sugar diacid utilization regulator